MKKFVCTVFGDRVNIYEAEVEEFPNYWEVSRIAGVKTKLYKEGDRIVVGTMEEIASRLQDLLKKRLGEIDGVRRRTKEDLEKLSSLKPGVTCMTTRGLRESLEVL